MKNLYTFIFCVCFSFGIMNAQNGNALHFDGSNDYVTAPFPTAISTAPSQNFTIEFWIKLTAYGSTVTLFNSQPNFNQLIRIFMNNSGRLYFRVGPNQSRQSTSNLPLNTWTHVAFVNPASFSNSKIYINGTDVSSAGFINITPVSSVDGIMTLGAETSGSGSMNGVIDEFRIWNMAKTAAEITATMNGELSLPQNNLAVYYKFNQGVANGNNAGITALSDELATSNGTLNNFALNGNTSNWVGGFSGLSVSDFQMNRAFQIAQNPVKDHLMILGLKKETAFNISDFNGRTILNGILSKENNSTKVDFLSKGLYFIQIGDEKLKFIKH